MVRDGRVGVSQWGGKDGGRDAAGTLGTLHPLRDTTAPHTPTGTLPLVGASGQGAGLSRKNRNGLAVQREHTYATQIPPKANLIGEKCWGSQPELCRERADLWLTALTKERSKAKLISLSPADERSSRSAKH